VCDKQHACDEARSRPIISEGGNVKTHIKAGNDVDMVSSNQLPQLGGKGKEAPTRAYYIGPWGDQMSVFAAKMDRFVDEQETKPGIGDDGSGIGDSSSRELNAPNAPDGSIFPAINGAGRGGFTDPGAD